MMGVNSFIEANQKTINELYNKLLLSKKKTRKDCKPETALVEDPVTYMSHVLQNNRQSLAKKNIINNFNTKLDAVLDSKLKPVKKSNSVEPLKLLLSTADKDAIEHPSGARSARALSFSGNSIPMNTTSLLEAEVKTLQLKFEKERLMRRELEKQIESLIKKLEKQTKEKIELKERLSLYEPVISRSNSEVLSPKSNSEGESVEDTLIVERHESMDSGLFPSSSQTQECRRGSV